MHWRVKVKNKETSPLYIINHERILIVGRTKVRPVDPYICMGEGAVRCTVERL